MTKKHIRLGIRLILLLLIVANLLMIFHFSHQSSDTSDQTSGRVTHAIANLFVKDFEDKTETEQNELLDRIHPIIRKLAHMTEFGMLGALIFLFLLTWENNLTLQYADALLLVLTTASIDEYSQTFSKGRAAQLADVGIDCFGAFLCCSFILLIVCCIHRKRKNNTERKSL